MVFATVYAPGKIVAEREVVSGHDNGSARLRYAIESIDDL